MRPTVDTNEVLVTLERVWVIGRLRTQRAIVGVWILCGCRSCGCGCWSGGCRGCGCGFSRGCCWFRRSWRQGRLSGVVGNSRVASDIITNVAPVVDHVPPQIRGAFSANGAALKAHEISGTIVGVRQENRIFLVIFGRAGIVDIAARELRERAMKHFSTEVKTWSAKPLDWISVEAKDVASAGEGMRMPGDNIWIACRPVYLLCLRQQTLYADD